MAWKFGLDNNLLVIVEVRFVTLACDDREVWNSLPGPADDDLFYQAHTLPSYLDHDLINQENPHSG